MKKGDIIQVGHVVRDLDKTMKYYWDAFRIGPWDVYTFDPTAVRESMVRGKPSAHTYLVAATWLTEMQLELMQPLTGRSIYDEHLEKKGEGLHHLKVYYPDCREAIEKFHAQGISVIQSGKIDNDEFYYLDTEKTLGYVIEVGNNGKIRPPERRYPA
jgi:methylmalonyl-CoA/ethylmalonyl-CoA epimerase